jgi:hypothetical protein
LPGCRIAIALALAATCGVSASAAGIGAPESPRTWRCGQVEMIVGGGGGSAAGLCPGAQPRVAAPAPAIRSERIATSTQDARDGERRAILEHELQVEELKLARLDGPGRKASPERETERLRIRDDIDALHRELARLR